MARKRKLTVSGRDEAVGIATRLQAGRFGVRIPVEAKFSAPLQTRPRTHLASYTKGNDVLSRGYSDRGVVLTTHHPVPRLKMSGTIYLFHIPTQPLWTVIRRTLCMCGGGGHTHIDMQVSQRILRSKLTKNADNHNFPLTLPSRFYVGVCHTSKTVISCPLI